MTGMTLELTTDQLQLAVIAFIEAQYRKQPESDWKEIYKELTDVFAEINRMCNENNGYKVTVEVTA